MIQANELRMGILIEKDNVMYKFLSLEQNHASTSEYRTYWVETLDQKLGKYYSTHFKPIPITPEILDKCGFSKYNTVNLWIKGDFYLHRYLLPDNEFCFKYNDFKSSSIKYLHQLQNLYFALTNTELNYAP